MSQNKEDFLNRKYTSFSHIPISNKHIIGNVNPPINNNVSFIDYRAIYSQEISNLKNELNIKNQTIEQQKSQIIYLQNQIINLNNFKQLEKNNQIVINNLKNDLMMKENELIALRNQLQSILNQKSNQMRFSSSAVDNTVRGGLTINFISDNPYILSPKICNYNDTIVKLEEELYNKNPIFKDYNTYLTCNGKVLKRFKTLKENGIQNGNAINIKLLNVNA